MSDPIEVEATPTTQAVAVVNKEQSVVNPLDLEPALFKAGLDRRKENRKHLIDWVREALVEGVDFGRVTTRRGPSKPSLWKPGAEKICGMLGVTPTFPTLPEYEQNALKGVQIKSIVLRCEIVNPGGNIIAHGVGCRDLAQDDGDLNKALKMAEKSAHIDATLRMAGLSEIFTQDIEDMARANIQNAPGRAGEPPPPSGATPVQKTNPGASQVAKPAPSGPPKELKHATAETRKWFCEQLKDCREQATQFCIDLTWLMPNEPLDSLPLRFVANTKPKMVEFMAKMLAWSASGNVSPPYEADWDAEGKPKPTQAEAGPSPAQGEAWYGAIIPIPRKGQKKDEYLKHPDTIGGLYELRHTDDDARKRLWGLCKGGEEIDWTPKPREFKGKIYQPSDADRKFYVALKQFKDWFDRNHKDTL